MNIWQAWEDGRRAEPIRRQLLAEGRFAEFDDALFYGVKLDSIEPMVDYPTPFIDTDAPHPDSAELADAYERKAAELEAGEASGPAQDIGRVAAAASFRRRAREMRERMK